jgi:hypothetical protein
MKSEGDSSLLRYPADPRLRTTFLINGFFSDEIPHFVRMTTFNN